MPTSNPRLNITLEPQVAGLLSSLAEQEHKSVASMAKELILDALERREDLYLSEVAMLREKTAEPMISHEDAWK